MKQITETDGTVTGTLLVTPNALMFDPDVMHPLVVENGQDLYIMMARSVVRGLRGIQMLR